MLNSPCTIHLYVKIKQMCIRQTGTHPRYLSRQLSKQRRARTHTVQPAALCSILSSCLHVPAVSGVTAVFSLALTLSLIWVNSSYPLKCYYSSDWLPGGSWSILTASELSYGEKQSLVLTRGNKKEKKRLWTHIANSKHSQGHKLAGSLLVLYSIRILNNLDR